jgi:EAL domain-containing protein (putative c-di-GMP-specific phosphodiesterase class I)
MSRFAATVAERLAHWDAPASALLLEITEDIITVDRRRALDVLARLSELNIALALDDYGTGHASLAQLKRLPVEELKIDRSFVGNLETDSQDAVIVRSTVELARNLGLRVVAEGVEDATALALLQGFDCDLVQGFHLERPVPAPDLLERLRARAPRSATAARA